MYLIDDTQARLPAVTSPKQAFNPQKHKGIPDIWRSLYQALFENGGGGDHHILIKSIYIRYIKIIAIKNTVENTAKNFYCFELYTY